MPKPSDVQWPESSSDDDFTLSKSVKKNIETVSLATTGRKRKKKRSTDANGSKALIPIDNDGDDLDIVATIGAP
jgi:hypothetical protein